MTKPSFTARDRVLHGYIHIKCLLKSIRVGKNPTPYLKGIWRTIFSWNY